MPDSTNNSTDFPAPEKRNLLIEQLEERALFNAVPIAPVDANAIEMESAALLETVVSAISAGDAEEAQQQEQVENLEILFVDKSVEGFENIVADFVDSRNIEVFFINDSSSGIEQIANHLEGRSDIQAIHIVSHGADGQLNLGNSTIQHSDLASQYSSELIRIGQALSDSGDILIYGCDLAASEDGETFIEELSNLTNADVAASDDLTGATDVGGNWVLEKQIGQIEASSLASESFSGTLLTTDAGFIVGTSDVLGDGEVAIVPQGQSGTSSLLYENAATANNGAISIDVRLTLIDTFDENGNLTTGGPDQLPVAFGNWTGGPVILARALNASGNFNSVSGFEGHTVEILVEFLDTTTGGPLTVVGDFTFGDIDFNAAGTNGSGAEAVTILADELLSFQVSDNPATDIVVVDNGDGTTTFTNDSSNGAPGVEEREVSIQFAATTQHTLIFTSRNGQTGYSLSSQDFSDPLSFTQPVAQDDGFTTDQNTTIFGNVISGNNGNGADSDPDGDTLTVALVAGSNLNVDTETSGSNGGLFTINSIGSYTFDPNGEFDFLPAGQTVTTTVTYQISDGTGLADEATVTVVVSGTDDAPVNFSTIPNQTGFETQAITSLDITAFFDAVDNDETLTFDAASTLPPGLTLNPTTGVISGTPNNQTNGSYTVSITATDSDGESTTQTFTWTIDNPSPTATDNTANVVQDTVLSDSGNVLTDDDSNGVDSDPDGDPLTVSAVNGSSANVGSTVVGSFGSVVITDDGTYTYTLDNTNPAVVGLAFGSTLNDSFTYTVSDGDGGTATASLNVTISNSATWTLVGDTSVTEGDVASYLLTLEEVIPAGESVSVDLTLTDIDTASDDYLSFVAAVDAAIAGRTDVTFNGTTLTYTSPTDFQIVESPLGNSFNDISNTGTALGLGSNGSQNVNIGFDFEFFGVTYSDLYVGADGIITFGQAVTENTNQNLADENGIDGAPGIAAFWDNFAAGNNRSDDIYFEVQGSPGSREFIVQWNEIVPVGSDSREPGADITYQVVLSEGSQTFEIRYLDTDTVPNRNDGGNATIGVTDGGSNFEQYSFNTEMITSNTTLTFVANGSPMTPISIDLGTVDDTTQESDEDFSITLSNATGNSNLGNSFEVTTTILDNDLAPPSTVTINDVTVDEGSGTATINASVDNAPITDLTITLSNNATITILAGQTTGTSTAFAVQADDIFVDGATATLNIVSVTGGDFESLDTTDTADVIVNDTIDVTTVTINDVTVDEGSGTATISASVDNAPQTDLTITLSNGETITILAGQTTGTSTAFAVQADDAFIDGATTTLNIASFTGGNFEQLDIADTALVTVNDTIDVTTVSLNDTTIDVNSGTATLTATVDNSPQSDLTITLNNGVIITILQGETSGTSVAFPADSTTIVSITGATGGNFEQLDITDTAQVTGHAPIVDSTTITVDEESTNNPLGISAPTDLDGDTLTITIAALPTIGTITLADGTPVAIGDSLSESELTSLQYDAPLDYNRTDDPGDFIYEVTDGTTTVSGSTDIIINPINDVPVAEDDTFTITEDSLLLGTVADNDTDQDGGNLVYSVISPPLNGMFSFDPDGSFTFMPNPDFTGPTSFEYQACDSEDACDIATVTINVTPVNDPPLAVADSETTSEDTTVVVDLLGNDNDPDGDMIEVTEINGVSIMPGETMSLPSGARVTLNSDGTVTYDPNGQYEDLQPGQSALDTFLYTISDGNGGTSVAETVIMINGENDSPNAQNDSIQTNIDTPVIVNVLGNDVDPEGEPLSVILLGQPTVGTATVNPDGTILYRPPSEFIGTVTLEYLVEDPSGAASSATVTIEIVPTFQFDSFTDFSKSFDVRRIGESPSTTTQLLSQKIFTLAPDPIFSGYSRPGAQIVGRIYDASGAIVGESSATTDLGGNWIMQFPNTKGHDFYRVEFEQISSGAPDVYGYIGLNPADNSYQTMEAATTYNRPLSVESALETSKESLEISHRHNTNPLKLGK